MRVETGQSLSADGGGSKRPRRVSSFRKNPKTTPVYVRDNFFGWVPADRLGDDDGDGDGDGGGESKTALVIRRPPTAPTSFEGVCEERKRHSAENSSRRLYSMVDEAIRKDGDSGGNAETPLKRRPAQRHRGDSEVLFDVENPSEPKGLSQVRSISFDGDTESPCRAPWRSRSSESGVNSDSSVAKSALLYGFDNQHELQVDPAAAELVDLSDYPAKTLPLQDVDEDGKIRTYEDMNNLPYLHEPGILYNLKGRYEGEDGSPYTRTGDIIVSVNPYRWIEGLYSERTRWQYAENLVWKASPDARKNLQPHVYELSSLAFQGLLLHKENQSIIVSGESGAGKTVTAKILMSHLATFHETKNSVYKEIIKGNSDDESNGEPPLGPMGDIISWLTSFVFGSTGKISSSAEFTGEDIPVDEPEEMHQTNIIIQRVLDSNPLLESFGNAKTILNGNSSRFSKYVKLQFHLQFAGRTMPQCNIAGSKCETFLLEKSRVVGHEAAKGERNFHIFYQLLEGAPEEYKKQIWDGLEATDASSFKYAGVNDTVIIEGLTDAQRWKQMLGALKTIGLKREVIFMLMRALCVVLQLGNLSFSVDSANEEGSVISSHDELEKLASILGVPSAEIAEAMISRTVLAGHDTYKVPFNAGQAKGTCDAFAKEIYASIFDWLAGTINDATGAEKNYIPPGKSETMTEFGIVGLLDIFGFESFEVNNFEQLCINHANERLQHKFTEDVFQSVRDEYESEGIDLGEVKFSDNSDVVDLIEGRLGLINLLNEECVRPKGSDAGFVNKVYSYNMHPDSPLIQNSRYQKFEFGVQHYAGSVKYNSNLFVIKNSDTMPDDVVECGLKSSNELIRNGLTAWKEKRLATQGGRKGALIAHTVWTKFKSQLKELMNEVCQTRTWYVRCINPNTKQRAGVMELKHTMLQLRSAGIAAAVTMSRSTFPNRLNFPDVLERFRFLAQYDFLKLQNIKSDAKDSSFLAQLLSMAGIDDSRRSRDVEVLLDYLFKPLESRRELNFTTATSYQLGNIDVGCVKPFVIGKTRVFFRSGSLEYLESERLKAFDRCATVIQCQVRRNKAVTEYIELQKNPPPPPAIKNDLFTLLNPLVPLYMIFSHFFFIPSWFFGICRR